MSADDARYSEHSASTEDGPNEQDAKAGPQTVKNTDTSNRSSAGRAFETK